MSLGGLPGWSLRLERAEVSRLAWAFGLSLAVHLLLFGTYQTGKKFQWWENWKWPAWTRSSRMLSELLKKSPAPQPAPSQRTPLMFVEVNPAQATTEPPPKADFYSDKNSRAANPEPPPIETMVPKIDGQQTDMVKTEDVPRTRTFPLQPSPPPPEQAREQQEEAKPRPTLTPGDLALAKPDLTPQTTDGQSAQPRPRTLREAMARQPQSSALTGRKMKQEGGVKRRALESSLDAIASPFGAYDAAIVAAVQNRWYDLLEERKFLGENTGKVQVRFHLNADGTVSQMKLMESTVDYTLALVCQTAISDPAPYAPWPGDMKRLVGADYREVTFTFFYY